MQLMHDRGIPDACSAHLMMHLIHARHTPDVHPRRTPHCIHPHLPPSRPNIFSSLSLPPCLSSTRAGARKDRFFGGVTAYLACVGVVVAHHARLFIQQALPLESIGGGGWRHGILHASRTA